MSKYRSFKEKILLEMSNLQAYTKMPSRPALSRKYNLSRATVDKAFRELVADGLLYTVKGSGTFIAPDASGGKLSNKGGVANWGVIVPNIMYDICPVFLRGIEDYTQQYDINIIICNTDNDVLKERDHLMRLARSGIAGVIIIPAISGLNEPSGFQELKTRRIPFVFCNRGLDSMGETPLITSNDFYGGYIATKHLIERGYRNIGFISRYRYRTSMNRFYGYAAALQESCLPINRSIISTQNNGTDSTLMDIIVKMLTADEPPDAFFCHNDEIACCTYNAVLAVGKRVSKDVGIVGYDNTTVCETLDTKLTSVSFKSYEIGSKAAQILQNMILGRPLAGANVFMFQPELVDRSSSLGPSTLPV